MYCHAGEPKHHGEECGCHGGSVSYSHGGGDCSHGGFNRHFMTQDERKKLLADYAEQLKRELQAVEERIKEM